jgi:hypothetical protein
LLRKQSKFWRSTRHQQPTMMTDNNLQSDKTRIASIQEDLQVKVKAKPRKPKIHFSFPTAARPSPPKFNITMGLMTKLKSRRNDDRSTFFAMRRTKSSAESSSGLFARKDNTQKLTHTLSQLTVVSIPKAYKEEERFNWLTNELDSFQYKPSDSVKANRKAGVAKSENNAANAEQESDCLVSDWLFPCWGSPRITDKDVKTAVTNLESRDETSYGSDSTEVQDNKEGEVLEAKFADDVSDITSTPSEDCSESEDEDCDSSCSSSAPGPRSSPVIGLDDDDALSLSSSES